MIGLTTAMWLFSSHAVAQTTWSDPVVTSMRSGLAGMTLQEGWIKWWKLDDCIALIALGDTCGGNNPTTPYAFFDFPDADDYYPWPHQLAEDEAIVFVGHTPPDNRYFSFNNFQHSYYDWTTGQRVQTMGILANSYHHLNLAYDDPATGPFQKYTVVIYAANETRAEQMRVAMADLLTASGYPTDIINISAMPYLTTADAEAYRLDPTYDPDQIVELDMGYGTYKDQFSTIYRVADPLDIEHPYFDETTINATVFRVAFSDPVAYDPFVYPHLPPEKATGEFQSIDLRNAQITLGEAVRATYQPPGTNTNIAEFYLTDHPTGFECINGVSDVKCRAATFDAQYSVAPRAYAIPDPTDLKTSIFVIGVNHRFVPDVEPHAPRVTYNNITLLHRAHDAGVASRIDDELVGSVDYYFPAGVPGLDPAYKDVLYVLQFSRNCALGNPYCVLIPETGSFGFDPNHIIGLVARIYLNETSETQPDPTTIWPEMAMAFGSNVHKEYTPISGVIAIKLNGF